MPFNCVCFIDFLLPFEVSLLLVAVLPCTTAVLLEGYFELLRFALSATAVRLLPWLLRLSGWSSDISLTLMLSLVVRLILLLWLPVRACLSVAHHLGRRALWTAWVTQWLIAFERLHRHGWCHLALAWWFVVVLKDWLLRRTRAVSKRIVWLLLSLVGWQLFLLTIMLVKSLTKRLRVFLLVSRLLLFCSVWRLCLFEALIWSLDFLVCLNTLVTSSVQFVIWRWLWSSVEAVGKLIIVANELVNFTLNQVVLIIEHPDMILKRLWLG